MTDIELNYSRLDAIELVVTAFEHVRELSEYEVDAENGVVTGHFNGGVTSFGATVSVSILEETDEQRTTIAVTASRQVGLNRNSNPWKFKSKFVQELRKLEGEPVEDLRRSPPSVRDETDVDRSSASPNEGIDQSIDTTGRMMHRGTRILLYLLGIGLGLMGAITAIALLV
ncbi:hypothetical protein ACFQS4_16245 [Saliphagus sp. GCM10025317]